MTKVIYPSGYEQEQVPSLSWQAQASASVGQATPANARPLLRNSACPGDPAGPASGVRTVWSLVWAAPCLDHSEPQFLSSLLWNGESLGRNRVVSSTQCSGLGKDTRCSGCPTGRKPAKEMGGAGAGSGRQLQGHTEVAQSEGPALKLAQPSTIPALPLQHLCPVSPSVNAHLDCACHRSRDQDQPAPTIPPRPVCSFERLQ